jgi:RimJ/RimL family protein N-acetyltransferase
MNTQANQKTTALYCRVSTGNQGSGLEAQVRALRNYCAQKGIELGVFEYNEPARRLYEKLGYQTKTIIPNFTWWKGRMWADHRLFKLI